MNKIEIAKKISDKFNLSKGLAEEIINYFLDSVIAALKQGEEVRLVGFGNFIAKRRSARMGVSPLNPSQKIQIKAVTVPKFKAGENFKKALK